MSELAPPSFFVSYSHHDTEWRDRLFDQSIETTLGVCNVWSDARIRAGENWSEAIDAQLQSCQVAVLLVSPKFLTSKFIGERELPLVLKRAEAESRRLRIVWVPIGVSRHVLTAKWPKLAEIQGAMGFDQALPARPADCPVAALEQSRLKLAQQMQAAVDPFGADLVQRLSPRYQVQRRLGEGQRAVVYLARDPQLNRSVAIKALRDPTGRDGFRADVEQALRTSEEPSFATIYDAAYGANVSYCVMQHVEGKTLESLLGDWARKEIAPPDANALRRVFVKLLRAVARAHRLGMPYGNLKPSNIVIDKHSEPFVLPVGRASSKARQMLGDLLQRLQQASSAGEAWEDHDLEEVAYLVPEQLGGPDQMQDDKLADQYMLGLLAYQMATGQRPLRVMDCALLLRDGSGAMGPLPPVSAVRPLFPERLERMIQRMTELDPGLRYPNLDQVLDEPDLHDDYSLVLARDSYRRCVRSEELDRAFFGDFYRELQRLYPATRVHLARIEGPDRWQRQHHMLKQAVLLLFAFAQRPDDGEPNVLSQIAESHAQIPPGLYVPFMKVLVAMVCGDAALGIAARDPVCGRAETARLLQKHWLVALKPGIDYLTQSGLRRDEAAAAATAEPAAPP